jgi:hypothetical protein
MAIEGASVAHGRPPAWFQRASDIRFTGYDHEGDDTPDRFAGSDELYQ